MKSYQILDIPFSFDGAAKHLWPVLLFSPQDTVLVDCGYPGFLETLESAMGQVGVDPASLTKLVVTHQDDDHMGAAAALVRKYPHVQVVASRVESPYISGKQKNLRLEQAEQLQSRLPEDQQSFGLQFCARLRQVEPVAVDIQVEDGDRFDWGGGCVILGTPGHTPGHISLFLPQEDLLITGDAAVAEGGALVLANPHFCLDTDTAKQSLARIKDMNCRQYVCYHSGPLY